MFFTECENLAKQHPDLTAAIQKIDAQFHEIRTAEVIRVDELASFLGLDTNQVSAILEFLAEAGILVSEEMVECAHCGMTVLGSDYEKVMKEDDKYRCTSCDRLWDGRRVQTITTYRRGEMWPELPPDPAHAEQFVGPVEKYPNHARIFKKQGKTWLVVYDGTPRSIGDSIGMAYICRLLQSSGLETHAAVLRNSVTGNGDTPLLGSSGDVLDNAALMEYRNHIDDLQTEIREAEDNHDFGKVQRLKEELEAVLAEIGRATGLGGKKRKGADDRERARQAVSVAIHRALKAIKREHEPLWEHLRNFLKIGEFLAYSPDKSTYWIT